MDELGDSIIRSLKTIGDKRVKADMLEQRAKRLRREGLCTTTP